MVYGDNGIIAAIERFIAERQNNPVKDYLDSADACQYLGVAKSYLYKLTHGKVIPYYKTGKKIYFERKDLEAYVTRHRIMSRDEVTLAAKKYSRNQ